jgi:hypothetical protein
MPNKYMQNSSTSLTIREIQIKTALRFHLIIVIRLSSRKQATNVSEDVYGGVKGDGTRTLYSFGGNENEMEISMEVTQKTKYISTI